MDFSQSGQLIASGDIDGAVRIYDSKNNQLKGQALNNHGRGVKCIKFTPDSSGLISGGEDLHMYLSNIETQ